MDINVHPPELARALLRVQGVVERRSAMPALANALIETRGLDRVRLTATDLEISVTADYPAEVSAPGSITLGARALYDIVRALPEPTARLRQTAHHAVEITSGRVRYRLLGLSPDGFPALPEVDPVSTVELDPTVLREMIDKTLYAVSTDETRYALTGVKCEATADKTALRMVSTDGHRLSLVERPSIEPITLPADVILPRKGLLELKKLLEGGDARPKIGFGPSTAMVERDGVTLIMRLIDGNYPSYQQVIPPESQKRVLLDRQLFQSALRRTSLLSPDRAQGVKVDIEPGTVRLSAANPDLGEAQEEIEAEFEGEPMTIGFNFRYLMDALGSIDQHRVVLEVTDEFAPGVLYGEDVTTERAIIMPMRI